MINLIESLFGFAGLTLVAAVVLGLLHRSAPARRLGVVGGASLIVAVLLELYVRLAS